MTAPCLPRHFWCLAFPVLLIGSPLVLPTPDDSTGGREWILEGTVRRGGQPTAGALIRIAGPVLIPGATSDASGHFVLKGTFSGTYTVTVSRAATGGAPPVTMLLGPGTRRNVTLDLLDEAVLSGTVLNSDRVPVTGGTVMAWVKTSVNGEPSFMTRGFAQTNDLGEFRIDELFPGQYRLLVALPPLRPGKRVKRPASGEPEHPRRGSLRFAFFPSSPDWESAAALTVQAGVKRDALDLTLQAAPVYCAAVVVRPPNGSSSDSQPANLAIFAPIAGTFIQVARGPVRTGESWEVCGLPAGTYKAVAVTVDPNSKRTTGFGKADFVISRRDVDLSSLMVSPPVTQSGTFRLLPTDHPQTRPDALSITLNLRNRPIYFGENRAARFQDADSFEIEGAFQDDYSLAVAGLPAGYYLRAVSQEGREVLHSPVRAGAGDIVVTVAADGPQLSGRTLDREGAPVAGAGLALIEEQSGRIQLSQSDVDGRYQFRSGVAPGHYVLVALRGLMAGEESDEEVFRQQRSRGTSLLLSPGESRHADVVVRTLQR